MKAAVIAAAGAAPTFANFPDEQPQGPEVSMRFVAAGIHPVVRSLASGTHYGSEGLYPFVPGVDAVAEDPNGQLSYAGFVRAPWGTFSERFAARPGLPLPAGADAAQVAGSLNPGMSSWLPLAQRKKEVGGLGTVLVVGATGAAGRLAIQIANEMGATRVVGVGRNADRLAEIEKLGAVPVSLGHGAAAIATALDGTTPSIVLDYVWGSAAEAVWESLARTGLDDDTADIAHIQIGAAGGSSAALPAQLLRSRRIVVSGSGAGSTPIAEIMAELPRLVDAVASGRVQLPIRTFPLSRIADAWAYQGSERVVVVAD